MSEVKSVIGHVTKAVNARAKAISELEPSNPNAIAATIQTVEALLAINALAWLVSSPELANAITELQKANRALMQKVSAENNPELN